MEYYLYLKDRTNGNLINLRSTQSYSGDSGEYSLIVSNESIVIELRVTSVSESYCYPNPVRGGEKVSFVVPENKVISLKIFNIAGELVYEKEYGVGESVEWDCRNSAGEKVASGIYIYFIRDDISSKTGKLGVMR